MLPCLVQLPAGQFLMGETAGDKFANDTERPQHVVNIGSFHLAKFPVVVDAFREFSPGHSPGVPGEFPVTNVTWDESVAYCLWLGERNGLPLRLPNEEEWEYAARAGTAGLFPWGTEITLANANFLHDESGKRIGRGSRTPAETYPPNAFGIEDLLGNVAEWTQSPWRPNYSETPAPDPTDFRVIRGGAWDYMPRLLRPSWRDFSLKNHRRDNLGFRIAATLL